MSRTAIQCPACTATLAVRHHGGRIIVHLEALAKQALVKGGTELTCRCGQKRFVRIEVPTQEPRAA